LLVIVGTCLCLLAAAGGSGGPAPLRIAVEGPQSGEQATNGLDQLRGVRLAVSRVNASGGLWNGRKVVVVAVSADADTTLASWAKDADFPFVMASDQAGSAGTAYGAWMPQNKMDNRLLYVVAPDGRIAYVAKPFKVMAQDSYTDLAAAVDKLAPPPTSSADAH